jgi:capsular exopolysaccharide synthesis family protein
MSRIFEALRQSELENQRELEAAAAAAVLNAPPPVAPAKKSVAAEKLAAAGKLAAAERMAAAEPVVNVENTALEDTEMSAVAVAAASATVAPVSMPTVPSFATADQGKFAEATSPALDARELSITADSGTTLLDLAQLSSFRPDPEIAGHLVSMLDEHGLGAEKFRVLATRLANMRRKAPLKLVQVTSSITGEGKTLIACNLAFTLAKRSGQTVLLIEGDLRKPRVCSLFGLNAPEGLGEWSRLTDGSILPFLRRVADTNLCVLPAGSVQHPVALLQSGRLAELIRQLAGWFDWVVVDTPPLLPMADSNLWARVVDGTLLVIRSGLVPRRALRAAVESMDGLKLLGMVLNDAPDFSRYDYYDRYYSAENDPKSRRYGKTKAKK